MRRSALVVLGLISLASPARADTELKNDGFTLGGMIYAQVGFIAGEIGASRFVAPEAGRDLLRVQFLFSGSTAMQMITLKVYDDTGGTDAPGAELYSDMFSLTGSDAAFQEITLPPGVTVPAQFRVGVLFHHNGLPSIARDANGIDVAKNYVFDSGMVWRTSTYFGVAGDWILRAFISDGGGTAIDGAPDAGATGNPCNGNGDCSTGQFCDVANHACTFDCRTDSDCGGGTCNSLGQCVGGGDPGGCCQADQGVGTLGALLGVGVFGALLVRRRRR